MGKTMKEMRNKMSNELKLEIGRMYDEEGKKKKCYRLTLSHDKLGKDIQAREKFPIDKFSLMRDIVEALRDWEFN